ncbi:MAG TPA: hypothetical protein VK083_17230 [Nocardia sp.]|uniref:hypothetical protein n=1 Tax=Nocardia TaxID=1817 RepID=UPI002456C7B1|nr:MULTISPECIES: hypothetical protein [Nocardia]HLS78528.1 hypothetical protein [Nocardia sp.]
MSGEPDGRIDAPDWVDQDLLTRDHSARLLDEEIDAEQARLAGLGDDQVAARARIDSRIEAMRAVRDRLRARVPRV